jgi:hypothetical protein
MTNTRSAAVKVVPSGLEAESSAQIAPMVVRSRQQISANASNTGGSSLTLVRRPLNRILRFASMNYF